MFIIISYKRLLVYKTLKNHYLRMLSKSMLGSCCQYIYYQPVGLDIIGTFVSVRSSCKLCNAYLRSNDSILNTIFRISIHIKRNLVFKVVLNNKSLYNISSYHSRYSLYYSKKFNPEEEKKGSVTIVHIIVYKL
jgi:hypothetical protein